MGTSETTADGNWYISGSDGGEYLLLIFLSMLESDEEKEIFINLYHQYGNAMLRIAKQYFPNDWHAAEDVVQNAWIHVIDHFQKILAVPSKKRGAYLVIIAKNEAITILRKDKRELSFDDTTVGSYDDLETDNVKSVIEVIHSMPATYRAVLEMKFVEEYTTKEISKRLGLTENAVNVRIHRGRTMLIKKLREEGVLE